MRLVASLHGCTITVEVSSNGSVWATATVQGKQSSHNPTIVGLWLESKGTLSIELKFKNVPYRLADTMQAPLWVSRACRFFENTRQFLHTIRDHRQIR